MRHSTGKERLVRKNRMLLATTSIAALLFSAPANAQSEAPADDSITQSRDALGVIVVTAQKREQDLQDVPVSISVVTGENIERFGTPRLDELSFSVPNLQITQDTISDRISIRGIGSGAQAGFEQSVGTFVNGVYRGRSVQSRFAFMDIASVEVLRGPQGTLFGKNTIAGALNITTARPTDFWEGGVALDYTSRFDQYETSGFISGPVADGFRTRVAFQTRNIDDGWITNSLTGDQYPELQEWGMRVSGELDVTPDTLLSFGWEHASWDNSGAPWEQIVAGPLAAVGVEDAIDGSIAQASIDLRTGLVDPVQDFGSLQRFEGDTDELRVSLEHEFGNGGTLTALGSYSRYDFRRPVDADIAPYALLRFDDSEDQNQTTVELRYASDEGNVIDYLIGAFYLNADLVADGLTAANISTLSVLTAAGCAAGDPTVDATTAVACGQSAALAPLVPLFQGVSRYAQLTQNTETWALFGQATWRIADQVRITGGLRYSHEVKTARQLANAADYIEGNTAPTANPLVTGVAQQLLEFTTHDFQDLRREENSITWSANVQWNASDDIMVYGTAATGFKAGGFNSFFFGANPDDVDFEDESALSFEIGVKTTILDGSAELNVAAFHTSYDNLQVAVFSGDTTFVVDNAASATAQGIELDSRWQVTDELLIAASAAYLDFQFDEFTNQACTNDQFLAFRQARFEALGPAGAAVTNSDCSAAGINDLVGRTSTDTPEFSSSITASYTKELGSFLLEIDAQYNFMTSVFRQSDLDPILETGDIHLLNAGLRFGPIDGPWRLGVRVNNLTNENEITAGNDIPLSFGAHFGFIQPPRSVTISGSLRF